MIIKCLIISQFWIKCISYKFWLINSVICQSIFLNHSKWVQSLAKLTPNWNNFRKKLLHILEDLTLEQFEQHLRIEEESRVRDGTNTNSKVNMNNVSNVQSGSLSKTDKYLRVNKSGSGFKKNNSNKDKKNRACFDCGKKGHYIHKCKLLKNKKKDEEGNAIEMNV